MQKHWSKFQLLHQVVQNPNIHIKGQHSYYSDSWDKGFEDSVVRYLHGDSVSKHWQPRWPIDQLYIGDYVCIAAEVVILMGGNHNHNVDWFSLYPFLDDVERSYRSKGDTIIRDGAWIGMRAMILPGIEIGEGAVIAANSVVTSNVGPYAIVGGNPAKVIKYRFSTEEIAKLLAMNIYDWRDDKFTALRPLLTQSNFQLLEQAVARYDREN
ncbi:MAG: CatB-related O-acetyltransferase [Shewanella sp.]|nr:CatB-related O-acetyltransferase [Shewanella sp.]MCF1456624.1 CatB-related O-acetyltransferase [Shewanella sp.]